MNVTDFTNKFNSTQYRDNFSNWSLSELHQYLSETDFPMDDIPAICQTYRELRLYDIKDHDVDFRDYCTDPSIDGNELAAMVCGQDLIDRDCFDDGGYYRAIANEYSKKHMIIGSTPAYYDAETVILTTND